jgi:hypothetical protein
LLTFSAATAFSPESVDTADTYPKMVPPSRVLTSEFANGGGGRGATRRDEITPLTADLRRVHFNVGRQVVTKLEAARDGLSHSIRGATMEQVLEAALDLLLEKQARARGQVKKPRGGGPIATTAAAPTVNETPTAKPPQLAADPPTTEPVHRRTGPREAITAAVRRAVWARDQGRCTWPLDSGGCCGSTHRLEFDHIVPWARFGGRTEDNLRVVCRSHNALAARQAFGPRWMERYQGGRRST